MSDDIPQRKKLFHTPPNWVGESEIFFLTINCYQRGVEQLTRPETGTAILDSAEYHNKNNNWFCRLLVLMPDHLHALISFPLDTEVKKFISSWKGYLAKRCGIIWQRDFFDHRIRNWESLDAKVDYIRENPVRKGLCDKAEEWPWVLDYWRE
jgi:putative transposase